MKIELEKLLLIGLRTLIRLALNYKNGIINKHSFGFHIFMGGYIQENCIRGYIFSGYIYSGKCTFGELFSGKRLFGDWNSGKRTGIISLIYKMKLNPFEIYVKLFNSLVNSIVLYASPVYAIDHLGALEKV